MDETQRKSIAFLISLGVCASIYYKLLVPVYELENDILWIGGMTAVGYLVALSGMYEEGQKNEVPQSKSNVTRLRENHPGIAQSLLGPFLPQRADSFAGYVRTEAIRNPPTVFVVTNSGKYKYAIDDSGLQDFNNILNNNWFLLSKQHLDRIKERYPATYEDEGSSLRKVLDTIEQGVR